MNNNDQIPTANDILEMTARFLRANTPQISEPNCASNNTPPVIQHVNTEESSNVDVCVDIDPHKRVRTDEAEPAGVQGGRSFPSQKINVKASSKEKVI